MNSFSKIKEKRSINSTKTNKENQPTKKERTKRKELKKNTKIQQIFTIQQKQINSKIVKKINTKRKKVNKKSLKVPNIRISQNKSKTCEYDPQNEKELYLKRIIIKSEINSSTVFQLNKRKNQNLTLTSHEMTNKDWLSGKKKKKNKRKENSNHNNNENNVQGGGKGLKNKKPQPRKWLKKRDEIFDDQTQFHSNLGLDTTINKKINKKLDKNILNNKNRNTNVNSFNNAGETKKVRIRNVGTIKYKKSLLKTIKFDRDGNPTFDSILNHFLIDFIEFSASEYNDENILFWSRANEFKEYCQQRKTKLARQMAYKIYKSHIIENSEKKSISVDH